MQSKFFPNLRPSPFVFLLLGLFFTQKSLAQWFLSGTWTPEKSLITYKVFHPMHDVEVDSKDLRGQVLCEDKRCHFQFKIANSSFRSAEKERDRELLVRTQSKSFPDIEISGDVQEWKDKELFADIQINWAGAQKKLTRQSFQYEKNFSTMDLKFKIPLLLSDFKITPPSLLGISIQNEIQVQGKIQFKKKGI
jgi:hypothetical protein